MTSTLEADVVVCGGGVAGTMAAVAAARNGADVLLVERYGFLGGNATAGAVAQFNSWQTAAGRRVVAGLADEVVNRLRTLEAASAHETFVMSNGHKMNRVAYAPETLKLVFDEMVTEAGVRPLLHASLLDVSCDGRHIETVRVLAKGGVIAIRPQVLIDATGDIDALEAGGRPLPGARRRRKPAACDPDVPLRPHRLRPLRRHPTGRHGGVGAAGLRGRSSRPRGPPLCAQSRLVRCLVQHRPAGRRCHRCAGARPGRNGSAANKPGGGGALSQGDSARPRSRQPHGLRHAGRRPRDPPRRGRAHPDRTGIARTRAVRRCHRPWRLSHRRPSGLRRRPALSDAGRGSRLTRSPIAVSFPRPSTTPLPPVVVSPPRTRRWRRFAS